jgi:uncharacterized membrane protein
MSVASRIGWGALIFFAIGVGVYPAMYFLVDMSQGFLASKTAEVLQSQVWSTAFYLHIIFGGISLLTGWSQFRKKFRNRNLSFHRTLGKIYLVAVAISGLFGLYIAFFATGGVVSSLGFGGLALAWLFTTSSAYRSIRAKDIDTHEKWMIRSYALTFAAVTLRIWLPLSQIAGIDFMVAYPIISWLCWVPNLVVAEVIVGKISARSAVTATA